MAKWILKSLVKIYQWTISPLIGSCCRFTPSCSEYALLALEKHGVMKGLYLIIKRLLKCGPWSCGGEDYP
ncbi:MAG: membrane protein insertion efficiency factor YidD [Chlamydiia bacterium]|nr:membrane protein insertion efficiency factor YidD [Chlamydiia bacterium]MCP5509178.1 membrane protein insertion efficiency factor YidD [Chlamydiales bacterium]